MTKRIPLAWMIGGAALACGLLLVAETAAAQAALPATTCDAVLANPDLHPVPEMPFENGLTAFSYGAGGSFVSGGGSSATITVGLLFQPGPDATIRVTALDEACGGANARTVFTQTFSGLTSVANTITYNGASDEIGLNGSIEKLAPNGTARYLFVDVWDGELPSLHATHSYLIDMADPKNPAGQ